MFLHLHRTSNCYIILIMSVPAHLKYIVLTILFLIATVNSTRTTMDILKSSKRLENLKGEVSTLEEKRAYLETTLQYKKTDEFVEEQARNALNLVKPGERVYVYPNVLGTNSERVGSQTADKEKTAFQLWYELFFE